MKKCPFCAEEIQDEAILCRYCGRDLPTEELKLKTPPEELELITPPKDKQPVWVLATIISGVLALFLFLYNLNTYKSTGAPYTVRLLIEHSLYGFVSYWIISAGSIWLWRKLEKNPTARSLVFVGLALIFAIWFCNS